MKLIFSLFFLIISLSSCRSSYDYTEPPYIKRIHGVESNHIGYMNKKYGAQLYEFGGAMMNQINQVSLGYEIKAKVNVEQARVIYVDSVSELLKSINADEQLKSDLSHYPFTARGIHIQIAFIDEKGNEPNEGYVALISMYNESIKYSTWNPSTQSFKEIHREPYEEAKRIVMESK